MNKDENTTGSENSSEKKVKFGDEDFSLPGSAWDKLNKNQGTEHLGEKPE